MTKIVVVHGNPGPEEEVEPLRAALSELGVPVSSLRFPLDASAPAYAPIASASDQEAVIVAYSFGCYLTLSALQAGATPPRALCLVSPHLVSSGALSPVVETLLSIPFVNEKLIGKGLGERVDEHLRKVFAPAPAVTAFRSALLSPPLWLRAARWKQLQAKRPLKPVRAAELPTTRIVRGSKDDVSPWQAQLTAFAGTPPEANVTVVEGAGHALPFTHPNTIRDVVKTLL